MSGVEHEVREIISLEYQLHRNYDEHKCIKTELTVHGKRMPHSTCPHMWGRASASA